MQNEIDTHQSNLINWFFVALGIIGVLLAILLRSYSEVISDLLISIGSTLIATSLLAYLYQRMGSKSLIEQLKAIQQSTDIVRKGSEMGILNLWQERRHIPNHMWNEFTKDARQEVWLHGVAEYGFACDEAFHQIIADGIRRGCNYRILLLDSSSPSAKYWDERDKSGIAPSKIRAATQKFHELIEQNKGGAGKIEFRVYDEVPSLSIVRSDGKMLITLYMPSSRGNDSPTLQIHDIPNGLFSRYVKHFDRLWNAAKVIAVA